MALGPGVGNLLAGRSRPQKTRQKPLGRTGNLIAGRPQPKPRPKPAPRTPSSGSSARAPSSGGSRPVSSNRTPGRVEPVTKPKPKPPPSVKNYLAGDTGYQQLLRGQQRTLADFLADIGRQRTEAKTSFGDVTRSMEQEKERALEAMQNEFASRGLLQSGLFGKEQGEYNQDWANQMTQLEQGQQSLLSDLLSQRTNFQREQQLAQEAARQSAIRRRAEKYGIG